MKCNHTGKSILKYTRRKSVGIFFVLFFLLLFLNKFFLFIFLSPSICFLFISFHIFFSDCCCCCYSHNGHTTHTSYTHQSSITLYLLLPLLSSDFLHSIRFNSRAFVCFSGTFFNSLYFISSSSFEIERIIPLNFIFVSFFASLFVWCVRFGWTNPTNNRKLYNNFVGSL